MEGLIKENGPFTWYDGTYQPVKNPWSFRNLTNIVWIDQPVGTGYSAGKPTATSEVDVATQFLGFWKNFMQQFDFVGKPVYLTGESYAGQYVPYISDAMFNANDTRYYDLQSIMMIDPYFATDYAGIELPAVPFAHYHSSVLNFNETYMASLDALDEKCGYKAFREEYFTYPPKPFPTTTPHEPTSYECDVWGSMVNAITENNPCFDIYKITQMCPIPWDVLGFSEGTEYVPAGSQDQVYFGRSDVKKLLHVPDSPWLECGDGVFVNDTDTSDVSALTVLPHVIERAKRTMIGHGVLDFVLLANGTQIAVQNMTWNGLQGFQTEPSTPFVIPEHDNSNTGAMAGTGTAGIYHTERGFTLVKIALAGHM
jgi:carboxypeptidase D